MSFAAPPLIRFFLHEFLPALSARMKGAPKNAQNELDRGLFTTSFQVFALRTPPKYCQRARKLFRSHLLCVPRMQVVAKPSAQDDDYLYLLSRYLVHELPPNTAAIPGNLNHSDFNSPKTIAQKFTTLSVGYDDLRTFVESITETDITTWKLSLTYEHFSIEHVLRTTLPANIPVPTSFESIGHIAHINLRDDHEAWKSLIGHVMLDKLSPRIKTVVNKTNNTSGPYRTFAMEVLAGGRNLITSVKENGCMFYLDFEKVYWNSRLETEHRRIVNSLDADGILVDAFCGVGPFAIPAAKQNKCKKVYANDLNPTSVEYLNKNIKANGIPPVKIETSCSCARDLIRNLIERKIPIGTVVMNFPAGAPEFLDMFNGLYTKWEGSNAPPMPVIHCYCFVKSKTNLNSAIPRIRNALSGSGDHEFKDTDIHIRLVRDVAPHKVQVCATFKLPEAIAYSPHADAPPTKRPKIDKHAY